MMTNLLTLMSPSCPPLDNFRSVLLLFASVALLLTHATENLVVHHVIGITDQSVTLSCSDQQGGSQLQHPLRDVIWSDSVHAESETARAIIFRSENNAVKRRIEEGHPFKDKYLVDEHFRLTIKNLESSDVGSYFCTSTDGSSGVAHQRVYEVSQASEPKCSSSEALTMKVAQTADFACEMLFGSRSLTPRINWYRGEKPVESIDQYEPGLARRDLHVTASVDDDRVPFRCVIKLGDVIKECSVTLIVPHSVRDVKFVDAKSIYYIGDEVRCTAKGSPLALIKLSATVTSSSLTSSAAGIEQHQVASLVERSGDGWRSIVVPDVWDGKHVTINCVASNTVDGKLATESASKSFNVTVPPRSAVGQANTAHWRAGQFGTIMTSLVSLLLATWPSVVIARVIC